MGSKHKNKPLLRVSGDLHHLAENLAVFGVMRYIKLQIGITGLNYITMAAQSRVKDHSVALVMLPPKIPSLDSWVGYHIQKIALKK